VDQIDEITASNPASSKPLDRAGPGAVLRVTRDRARSPDKRRPYTVFVDDGQVGELRRGETLELPVRPGAHVLGTSVDLDQSQEWSVSLAGGDVVHFLCRSRGKRSDGHLDLFLADPADRHAQLRPPVDDPDRDLAKRQRAIARDGQVLAVWAHRSGYMRSLDPGAISESGDEAFFLTLALYIVVLPVLGVLRWTRHRLVFKRGWSVAVVRKRRFLWPRKVRLERLPDEARARARAAEILSEVGNLPAA